MTQFSKKFLIRTLRHATDAVVVEDRFVDYLQWSIVRELVFAYRGHHYKVEYRVASHQDEHVEPFAGGDMIDAVEVEAVMLPVRTWVAVGVAEELNQLARNDEHE